MSTMRAIQVHTYGDASQLTVPNGVGARFIAPASRSNRVGARFIAPTGPTIQITKGETT